jgi:excisionase family DNA binding protein
MNSQPIEATPRPAMRVLTPRWYSPAEVAELLGFGLSKVKMKIATGELRSVKDGKHRRILPEWVDQYIRDQIERQEAASPSGTRGELAAAC